MSFRQIIIYLRLLILYSVSTFIILKMQFLWVQTQLYPVIMKVKTINVKHVLLYREFIFNVRHSTFLKVYINIFHIFLFGIGRYPNFNTF